MALGEHIRHLLATRGMSQKSLAAASGIGEADISKVINNKRECPPAWRSRIGSALGEAL